jgi:hypothetical protein
MSRRVYVEVKVKLVLDMDDGVDVSDVISEMDYSFTSNNDGVTITDTEILDHEVTNSK